MRFFRRHTFWRRLPRRVGACAAVVAYLVATVGFPVPAVTPRTADAAVSTPARPCCCSSDARRSGSCCCFKPQLPPCCRHEQPAGESSAGDGLRWVGGPSVLGCRGLSMVWLTSGAVTAPPAAEAWQPFAAPAGWLAPLQDHPFRTALVPPDPPPRRLPA